MADASMPRRSPRFKDLSNQPFGRLTVLGLDHVDDRGRTHWKVRCSCARATEKIVAGGALRSGHTQSCGCLRLEAMVEVGYQKRTHGHSVGYKVTPEYQAWTNMIRRCYDPNDIGYDNYGARGITVCDEWLNNFEAFLRYMGLRPSSKHSIDREKNDRGYEPGNCHWATAAEQANNRRSNWPVTYQGRTMNVSQWARELGLPRQALRNRLANGWPISDAFTMRLGQRPDAAGRVRRLKQ